MTREEKLEKHRRLIAEGLSKLRVVPEHLQPGLRRYLEAGIQPGDALCACLDNDLFDATYRWTGDLEQLKQVMSWLYLDAPSQCWRSRAKRLVWQEETQKLVRGDGSS